MTMGRRAVIVGCLVLAAACSSPRARIAGPTVTGQRIAVLEFSSEGTVVKYNEPHDTFGLALAEAIADELRKRGHQATAVRRDAAPDADVLVRGRMTEIDGGSRALRYWVSFGAGAAKFGAEGDVVRADGTPVATFWDGHGSGFGFFGGTSADLLQKCIRRTGMEIAKMIDTGSYQQTR